MPGLRLDDLIMGRPVVLDRQVCPGLGRLAGLRLRVFGRRQFPHHRAARHFHDEVLAGVAIHALAHAELSVLGDQPGLIILGDQVVQVVVGFQDDIAAATAVAPARTAFRAVLLALKCDASLAAMARPGSKP